MSDTPSNASPALPRVGIEKMAAYGGTMFLDLHKLAEAREHPVSDLRDNLLVRRRTVNPLWEDPVTMAVNAGMRLINEVDQQNIRLVIVSTESGVDQGKAMATFVHRYLGLQPNCRCYEAKQACYSGTASVMMACHWLRSQRDPDARALVISTDQSRMNIGKPYEFVAGGGAVAMVLSRDPEVLEIELDRNGFWTNETWDTFRPTLRVETGNGEESLFCYLDALEGAFDDYRAQVEAVEGQVDWDTWFNKNLFHVPLGGITFMAFRALLRNWRKVKKKEAWELFSQRSLGGLTYTREVGATYSGSTYMALLGLIDSSEDLAPGQRVGIFSYGSGSVGEYYSGIVGSRAREVVGMAGVKALLASRKEVSVEQYEALERGRHDLVEVGDFTPDFDSLGSVYDEQYRGKKLLVLNKIEGHIRDYGWS